MGELINGRTPEQIRFNVMECAHGHCLSECPYDSYDECTKDILNDALTLIEHLEAKVQKWISVEERLPEDGETALTYKNGIVEVQVYEKKRNGWIKGNWFWSMATVSHWMPLPEPPKEFHP